MAEQARLGPIDEWRDIEDAAERRKIQNRNAQRRYRQRSRRQAERYNGPMHTEIGVIEDASPIAMPSSCPIFEINLCSDDPLDHNPEDQDLHSPYSNDDNTFSVLNVGSETQTGNPTTFWLAASDLQIEDSPRDTIDFTSSSYDALTQDTQEPVLQSRDDATGPSQRQVYISPKYRYTSFIDNESHVAVEENTSSALLRTGGFATVSEQGTIKRRSLGTTSQASGILEPESLVDMLDGHSHSPRKSLKSPKAALVVAAPTRFGARAIRNLQETLQIYESGVQLDLFEINPEFCRHITTMIEQVEVLSSIQAAQSRTSDSK